MVFLCFIRLGPIPHCTAQPYSHSWAAFSVEGVQCVSTRSSYWHWLLPALQSVSACNSQGPSSSPPSLLLLPPTTRNESTLVEWGTLVRVSNSSIVYVTLNSPWPHPPPPRTLPIPSEKGFWEPIITLCS